MNKKILVILIGTCVFMGPTAFAEPLQITFDNLKSLLTERSSRIQTARLEKEAATAREGNLGRSFLPTLEVQGAQETSQTGSDVAKTHPVVSTELRVNLFNGGRDQIESEIRKITTEARTTQELRTLSEELQEARKLFWEIVSIQERENLIAAMIKINSQNLQAAEKRIRNGVATESDRVEFEIKSIDLSRSLAEFKLQFAARKREFLVLMGMDNSTELHFPKELLHSHDLETMLKYDTQDHKFLYREYEIQSQTKALAAKSQRRAWWPQLDAYAAYKSGPESLSDTKKEAIIGLRMTMNFASTQEAAQEAIALEKEATAATHLTTLKRQEIDMHIKNEIEALRFLHEQVRDSEANIARAEKYYRLTQSEYSRGVKNSPDVLGASERLFETKVKRIEIIQAFQISKSHLLSKIGR